MARRKSTFRKLMILGVLVLAVVGAVTVYNKYSEPVIKHGEAVFEKAERVKKVLEEPPKKSK